MRNPRVIRRSSWVALIVLLWVGWPASAASGATAEDCDAIVVDETGQLDTSEVEAAAERFGDRATVRVRFWDAPPAGTFDSARQELIARCWPGPGGIQSDLLLLMVSLEDSDVWLGGGEGLRAPLGGTIDAVRDDVVIPRLSDGRFTDAVVDGLVALEADLSAPPATEPVDPADPQAQPVTPAEDDGVGVVPLAALAGAVVVGGGAVAVTRRRRLNDRRRRLDESLEEPLGRSGDLRERNRQLELRAATAEHTLAGASLTRVGDLRRTAAQAGQRVDGAVQLVRQAIPDGVGQADHRQLERGEQQAAELAAAVEAHDRAVGALDRGLRRFEELADTLPTKAELLDEEIDDTRDLARLRTEEGWRTDELAATVERLDADLDQLDLTPLRLDLDSLSERIEGIEADLFATRHALQSLPERKAGLEEWAAQLANSVALERERAGAAAAEVDRLAEIHDPASLAELVDNPSAALDQLDRAEAARMVAMADPFEAQDWDAAGAGLEAAGLHLISADALLDEIDRASVELNDAQRRAGNALDEVRATLAEVQRFVAANDADLGPRFDTEPAAIESLLAGLGAELRRTRPNYLRVLQTAEHANAELDQLMVDARDESARVAALRRQALLEEDRAVGAINRARQALGWQILPSWEAGELDKLEKSLASLPKDLEARVTAAQAITVAARRIETRVVNRRRRSGVWVVGGAMGAGWGGGGGGGGSSGGGGFGGGGFGGGSFGGGGFGGGGFGGGIGGGGKF
jgi:hypothetical protein